MSYASNKDWRIRNPEKWYAGKIMYYKKHRNNPQNSVNSHCRWMEAEINVIIDPFRKSDSFLAKYLGRSVQSIQVKRSFLKLKKDFRFIMIRKFKKKFKII